MNERGQWLSTSQAAALWGVHPRAVQKRAARGSIPARKVGDKWEVRADAVDASNGRIADASTDANGRMTDASDVQTVPKVDASNAPNGRVQVDAVDAPGVANLRAQLERERGEVAFLRGIVESDRRDMAELRAALRKALDLAPKALPSGAQLEQVGTGLDAHQSAINAPQRGETGAAGNDSPTVASAPETRPIARETGFIDYGAIADSLEMEMN